jgi:hypothetical protein
MHPTIQYEITKARMPTCNGGPARTRSPTPPAGATAP